MRKISHLFFFVILTSFLFIILAWTIPNKIFPWTVLWNESAAAFAIILSSFAVFHISKSSEKYAISLPTLMISALCVVSAWAQYTCGLLDRAGDAWMVTMYVGLFTLAIVTGSTLTKKSNGAWWRCGFLLTVLIAGLVSASMVLIQWLWTSPSVLFLQEIEVGDRLYANLGQPNQASTLFFLALCAALQLWRERILGKASTLLIVSLLTFTMVLTQSRTGILQWVLLFSYGLWVRPQGDKSTWRWGLLVLIVGFLSWLSLPWLYEELMFAGKVRTVSSGSSGRLAIWHSFFDAVTQRPWAGWGWLQTGSAQQAIAAHHPGAMAYFSYTHLMPLDFVLWLGLPLGLLLSALLTWWLTPYLARVRSAQAGYWLIAVLGFGLHTLLEYPQAYLYFLLPVGLMIGVIEARAPVHRMVHLSGVSAAALSLALACLAAVIFWDVLLASKAYTEARFAEARIGIHAMPPDIPQLRLLDQLEALVQMRATSVEQLPSQNTLYEAGRVAKRQPMRWVSLRYAQLLALAGQTEKAAHEQQRLCDIHGIAQCALSAQFWEEWRNAPSLQAFSLLPFQGRSR